LNLHFSSQILRLLGGSVPENSVQRRSLHRAAEIVGGPAALARTLGVPEPALRMWLDGRPVPPDIFLRAVDIIIEHDIDDRNVAASQQQKEA
jgi:DNA-binding transcriptional regulator YdaS (Cro superfamily)